MRSRAGRVRMTSTVQYVEYARCTAAPCLAQRPSCVEAPPPRTTGLRVVSSVGTGRQQAEPCTLRLLDMSARPGTMRLREAVERGDGDAVQQELDAGVPVDAAGRTRWTSLHRAVDRGHVHIVRILCTANANPNVRTETGGDTPMHIAAAKGDTASVSELLRVGADPRLKAKNGKRACVAAVAQ